jgi:hypothetical protein
MDVIGFLYVSLVSSAVKVADAHAHVQRLVSVVKMETVLEECDIEEQRCFCVFLFEQKDSIKGYSRRNVSSLWWKCLSCRAVRNWVEKRGKSFADNEEVETEVRKWLRQQSKDFYAAGVDALVKRWDKCINVGGGYVEK